MSETKNERQPWQHTLTDGLLSVAGIICLVCGVVATVMGNFCQKPSLSGSGTGLDVRRHVRSVRVVQGTRY